MLLSERSSSSSRRERERERERDVHVPQCHSILLLLYLRPFAILSRICPALGLIITPKALLTVLVRFFFSGILQIKGGILSYFIPFLLCALVLCMRIKVVVVAIRMIALDKQVPAPRKRKDTALLKDGFRHLVPCIPRLLCAGLVEFPVVG
jgi:hypothetical protein